MDNPEIYSVNNQHQKVRVEEFFNIYGKKLRNEFNGKEIAVLDIGTACGTVLNEVIVGKSGLKFSKVVGVDIVERMVTFANEKFGNDLTSFYVMNAEGEVPEVLKNQKFDLITSFFCLHYISDFDKAFRNIKNLLKPNGIFCCIFMQTKKETIQRLVESEEDFVNQLIDFENLPNISFLDDPAGVIKSNLGNNGMDVVNFIDNQHDEFEFDNLEVVKSSFEIYAPKLAKSPERERLIIYEKLFKLFELKAKKGKFVLATRTITFIAQKQGDAGVGVIKTAISHL